MSLTTPEKVANISSFINGTDYTITLKQIHDFNTLMLSLSKHYGNEFLVPSSDIMYALHKDDMQSVLMEYMDVFMNRASIYQDLQYIIHTMNNNAEVYDSNYPTSTCDTICIDEPIVDEFAKIRTETHTIYDDEFFADEPTLISTDTFTDADFKSEDEIVPVNDIITPDTSKGPIVLGTIDLDTINQSPANKSKNTLDNYVVDMDNIVDNIEFEPTGVHLYHAINPTFTTIPSQNRSTVKYLLRCKSLSEAFEEGQASEGSATRSTSIGDVICVQGENNTAKYFIVCGVGFKEISRSECIGIAPNKEL